MKAKRGVKCGLFALLLVMVLGATLSDEKKPEMCTFFATDNAEFWVAVETFRSPSNRWKPGEEPFPVDLGEYTRKAKEHFLRGHPRVSGPLECVSTQISPSTLADTGKAGAEGTLKLPDAAWYLVFDFAVYLSEKKQWDRESHSVVMMLNGAMLESKPTRFPAR